MLHLWVQMRDSCDPGSIGWLATGVIPNFLSSAFFLYFSGIYMLCVIVSLFLSFLFCFVFVFMLSLELCRCPSDLYLSSRTRTGLATMYIAG